MIDKKIKRSRGQPKYSAGVFDFASTKRPRLVLYPDDLDYGGDPIERVSGLPFTRGAGVTWGRDEKGPYLEFDGTSEAYLQISGIFLQSIADTAFSVVGEYMLESPVTATEQVLVSHYQADEPTQRGVSLGVYKAAGVGYQTLRYPSPNIGAGSRNAPLLLPKEGVFSTFCSSFIPYQSTYATWPAGFDSSTGAYSLGYWVLEYANPSVVLPTCPVLIGALWTDATTRAYNLKGKVRWLAFFDGPVTYDMMAYSCSKYDSVWAEASRRFVRRYPAANVPRTWYYSARRYVRAHRAPWEEAKIYAAGEVVKTHGHTLVALRGGLSGVQNPVLKAAGTYTSGSMYYNAFSGLSSFRGTPLRDGTVLWRVISGTSKDTPIGSVAALNKMLHSGDTVRFDTEEGGFDGGDAVRLAGTAIGLERWFGTIATRVQFVPWDFAEDRKGVQSLVDTSTRSVSIDSMRASFSLPRVSSAGMLSLELSKGTDLLLRDTSAFTLGTNYDPTNFISLWNRGKLGAACNMYRGMTSTVVGGEYGYSSYYIAPSTTAGSKTLIYGAVFGESVLPSGGYSPDAERGARRMVSGEGTFALTNCYTGLVGVTVPNRIAEWNSSGFYRTLLPGLDSSGMMGRTLGGSVDSILGPTNGYASVVYRTGGGAVKGMPMSVAHSSVGLSATMSEREFGARYNRDSYVQYRVYVDTPGSRVLKVRGMVVKDTTTSAAEAVKAQAWIQATYYDTSGVRRVVTTMPDTLGMDASAHVVDTSMWQVPALLVHTKMPFSLSITLPNARAGMVKLRVMYAHGYTSYDSYDTGSPYSNRVWFDPVVEIV